MEWSSRQFGCYGSKYYIPNKGLKRCIFRWESGEMQYISESVLRGGQNYFSYISTNKIFHSLLRTYRTKYVVQKRLKSSFPDPFLDFARLWNMFWWKQVVTDAKYTIFSRSPRYMYDEQAETMSLPAMLNRIHRAELSKTRNSLTQRNKDQYQFNHPTSTPETSDGLEAIQAQNQLSAGYMVYTKATHTHRKPNSSHQLQRN